MIHSPRVRLLLPEGEERDFSLQADYFDGQLDLKAFCASQPHHPIVSTNPLVLEPQKGSYVFLSRFGGIVFWNCPEPLIRQIHEELRSLPSLHLLEEQARDFLKVSLALAQSVALDHFEGAVSQVMARFQPVVAALTHNGKLILPHREVLRIVGFAMEVRAAVLNNLTLFDDPPETWESEALAHLDSALYDQFDLDERLGAIREKLAYLQDAGATFLGLLETRKGQRLEWVIILLILVEILLFIGKDLFPAISKVLK